MTSPRSNRSSGRAAPTSWMRADPSMRSSPTSSRSHHGRRRRPRELDAILPVVMVRLFEEGDTAAVVALSLRAWEPVHASLREVMGDELFDLRHEPDWRVRQQEDVESVLSDETNSVWVADEGEVVVGFAAVAIRPGDRMGEVLM